MSLKRRFRRGNYLEILLQPISGRHCWRNADVVEVAPALCRPRLQAQSIADTEGQHDCQFTQVPPYDMHLNRRRGPWTTTPPSRRPRPRAPPCAHQLRLPATGHRSRSVSTASRPGSIFDGICACCSWDGDIRRLRAARSALSVALVRMGSRVQCRSGHPRRLTTVRKRVWSSHGPGYGGWRPLALVVEGPLARVVQKSN